MLPALHVQIIRTTWTKRSRGAPAATARSRVPLALPLGVAALQRGQLSVAVYHFGEPDFVLSAIPRIEFLGLNENLRYEYGAFALNWDGHNATTLWHWSALTIGAPKPKSLNRDMGHFEVAPKTWVSLRWHGRFSDQDTGHWSYQHTVVNVARCDENLNVDFAGEPSRRFEWLPQLR